MAEKDLKKWTTFFHEAGIPRGPATEYSTLFCDHRIKDDLLGDLSKDILNDIGITVMGDIMSILKHGRAVYAKLEREKSSNRLIQSELQDNEPEPVSKKPEDKPILSSTLQMKKKKVVSKLVNKPKGVQLKGFTLPITRKVPVSEPKITISVDDNPIVKKTKPSKTTLTLSERFASDAGPPSKVSRLSVENSGVKTSSVTKVPAKSTVPMDKGVSNAPVKRKSAFERLGKEEPMTLSKEMDRFSPKIKLTKTKKSSVSASPSKVISLSKNDSSVFKRLGEADSPSSATSTSRSGALTIRTVRGLGSRIVSDDHDCPEKPDKSHSVLRPLKPIRAVQPVKPVSTVKGRVSVETTKESSNKKSVFSRLGS